MSQSITDIRIQQTSVSFNTPGTLYNILIELANGDLGNVIDAALKGLKPDAPLEQRAYTLVAVALGNTCRHIYTEDEGLARLVEDRRADFSDRAKRLEVRFRDLFERDEYYLSADAFHAPQRLSFVGPARALFRDWLQSELGVAEARSATVTAPFPNLFLSELIRFWFAHKDWCAPLEAHLKNNPFAEVQHELACREAYCATLKSYYGRSPFGDPNLSLSDLYVAPDFKRFTRDTGRKTPDTADQGQEAGFEDMPYEGGLHAYFFDWLSGKRAAEAEFSAEKSHFMLLLGQPGQGKSSFGYRTMYQLLEETPDKEIFFVRLKDIIDNDLITRPLEVVRKYVGREYYKRSDQSLPSDKLQDALLLLDGLDELYMHKGLNSNDLHEFVDRLSKETMYEKGLRVLVTARHHYLDLQKLSGERHLVLQLKPFSLKQQLEWLDKYALVYPDCALVQAKARLHEVHKSKETKVQDLKNLYNQPILLHLMAQAGFVPELEDNKAKIYELMFKAVIERRRDLKKYENLSPAHLHEFLQTLAWYIFQSDFEYVRKIDFEQSEVLQRAADKIQQKMGLAESAQPIFLRELLVSFYFKNVPKHDGDRIEKDRDDYALEFYHKSLYEYLAAEYAVHIFKKHFLEKEGEDYKWEKRDGDKVLKTVFDFFNQKILSKEVADYFAEIIQNDETPYNGMEAAIWKKTLFERMRLFYPYMAARDFLYEWRATGSNETIRRPMDATLAVFYACTLALGALIPQEVLPADASEEARAAAVEKWSFVPEQGRGQLHFASMLVVLRRHYSDLKLVLTSQNLRGAYLIGAYLRGADLRGADLRGADLRGADLSGADLSGADLSGADLSGADLSGADLRGADLHHIKTNNDTKWENAILDDVKGRPPA